MAALVAAAAVALIGGCSSSTPTGQAPTDSASATLVSKLPSMPPESIPTGAEPPPVSTPPPPGPTVTLREADRGRTVTVKVNEVLTLTLNGTDWGFTDPKPPEVLTAMSPPIVAREPGTSSISFRAAKAGTAAVTATRTSGDTYQITVVVQ